MLNNIINSSVTASSVDEIDFSGKNNFQIRSIEDLKYLINLDLLILHNDFFVNLDEMYLKTYLTKSLRNMGLVLIFFKKKPDLEISILNFKHIFFRMRSYELIEQNFDEIYGDYLLFRYTGPSYHNQIHIYSTRHKVVDKIWSLISQSKLLTSLIRYIFHLILKIKSRI